MMAKSIIKNKKLVSRMSLEQKLSLITSTAFGENCPVDNYAFPVFKLSRNPAAEDEGMATVFPSEKALACTWNPSLVKDVYKCIGNEAKANAATAYFNVTDSLAGEGISEDYYFAGSFLAHKALGLNLSGVCVNFEDAPDLSDERTLHEQVKLIKDFVLREAEPDSVLLHHAEEAEEFFEKYSFKGLLYCAVTDKEEAARCLFLGSSLIFLKEDFTEELYSYLSDLIRAYDKAQGDLEAGKISLSEFDRRQRNLEILDGGLIDSACDRLIDILLKLKENHPASVGETPLASGGSHTAKFNGKFHELVAYRAAQQSVVLLKNRENALPLNAKSRIAVVGEYAKNSAYRTELTANGSAAVRLPFEAINDYELNAIGYAHGYLKGESGRSDLIETACVLCAEADYALVYLSAEKGASRLPKGQLELLSALSEKGVKIIAAVSADVALDFSFIGNCEAVLSTYRGGQAEALAVLDILTGKISPSGKLTEQVSAAEVCYPFGYGLSYTQFEYKNLKITENGVSCTVSNTGNHDGFATLQLYVRNDGTETTLSQNRLRGLKKVFIKRNDAVKVEIPFDGNTFRTYDAKKKRYRVEGGEYHISVSDSSNTEKLSGEITLSEYVYDREVYANEPAEHDGSVPVGFTDSEAEEKIRRERKGLPFGIKLFLTVVFFLYYNAVGAVLLLTDIIAGKDLAFYITTGVLMLIGDVLAVIYLAVIVKQKKRRQTLHHSDVLSDMLDKVTEFREIAKLSYAEPVPQDSEEFTGAETSAETSETQEPVSVLSYENPFGGSGEEETVFEERVSFSEICANFRAYALSRGIAVEPSSVRAVFAAVCSAKLVLLSCKNREILPDVLAVLNSYFGNGEYISASGEWQSKNELLWRKEGDKFVPSAFTAAVNAARESPEKNCAVIVNNVNAKNLQSYFGEFIAYALHPSEEHCVALNEELSIVLPHNLCYFLVSDEEHAEPLSADLVHASLQVEIVAGRAEADAAETEIKALSRTALAQLAEEAKEKCFLPEKFWKKTDKLSETICATERFEIGNKDVLQLEKFSAVLLDSGGDESEASVAVFTAKLVPLLKLLKTYRKENGGNMLYGIIEKLFGEEDISKIQKLLVNIA